MIDNLVAMPSTTFFHLLGPPELSIPRSFYRAGWVQMRTTRPRGLKWFSLLVRMSWTVKDLVTMRFPTCTPVVTTMLVSIAQ
jgi:hypothetical protein